MKFEEELVRGRLIRRYKRFLADVETELGKTVTVHCANSGSMLGCDEPGSEVILSRSRNLNRKLPFTWELVRVGQSWVGINTMRPNRVVEEAIRDGLVAELRTFAAIQREVCYGANSRIDLLLDSPQPCYVEVKNVTLAEGALALFPDAVTERGTKHLYELSNMVEKGYRAVMFYLINRQDCDRMAPAWNVDPVYADALVQAVDNGVEALAYRSRISETEICLDRRVALALDPAG